MAFSLTVMLAFQERKQKNIVKFLYSRYFLARTYNQKLDGCKAGVDFAEDVTDDWAKNH